MRKYRLLSAPLLPALVLFCLLADAAGALEPTSPEVQALVDQGLHFLASSAPDRENPKLGLASLRALPFAKMGHAEEHPLVRQAVELCRSRCELMREDETATFGREQIYENALAIVLLATLDAQRYESEIQTMLDWLLGQQKPHGAWGYLDRPAGDTSMTQNAVLALWEVHRKGFALPEGVLSRVTNWLILTQDPGGAWGYQGVLGEIKGPGQIARRRQSETRHSMAAAGAGTVLLCAHLLGKRKSLRLGTFDLPSVLVPVRDERGERNLVDEAAQVDDELLGVAIRNGQDWLDQNYQIEVPIWNFYYLYSFERYQTFREIGETSRQADPTWYDDGVKFLQQRQRDHGGWDGRSGETAATSFALLFLLRSTRRSLEGSSLGEGSLVGGRGLPNSLVDVRLKRGRIVAGQTGEQVDDVVSVLSNPAHPDFDYFLENPEELKLSQSKQVQVDQFARLQRLAREAKEAAARRAAIVALARTGQLDAVPTMIDALEDDDIQVMRAARDGLRAVSRKRQGFGLGDSPDAAEIRLAARQWSRWYYTLRPGRRSR